MGGAGGCLIRRFRLGVLAGAALCAAPVAAVAQTDTARATATSAAEAVAPRGARGIVQSRGVPLAGVNVFDLETLEGAMTASDGRFLIPVTDSARKTVRFTARRIGYKPVDTTVAVGTDTPIGLVPFAALATVTVQAGRYTATAERTATLSPVEVATIPGSNADINSAIKTLPGVQNVDEGNGLFVRGGDFTETKIFVDGAPLFTAYQFEAPTGSVAGTINPFLTDAITFSSGGFGAQWGNALSGVVDLRTQGRPLSSYVGVNASILNVALSGGLRMSHGFGVSGTVGFSDLTQMLALNGNVRKYTPAPNGTTISGVAAWEYSKQGSIKLFALRQTNGMGIPIEDPAFATTYLSERSSDIAVLSLRDTIGNWRPFISASTSGFWRDESKGAYDEAATLRSIQLRAETMYEVSDRFNFVVGAEAERVSARFDGKFPANAYNPAAGAPTTNSSLNAAKNRDAAFLSLDTRPLASVEFIAGIRSDRSGFTDQRTTDPRLSIAWVPREQLTFTGAWGMYHQVADPAFLDRLQSGSVLPPLRAEMSIAGVQIGEGAELARVELWTKRYSELVGLTRKYETVSGLPGRASGADFFARFSGPWEVKYRLTWSVSQSRRDDPNTRTDARASFDVVQSITAVAERDWAGGWHAGIAYRQATGHPFTDITGATYNAGQNVYVPTYGTPYGSELPIFRRTDLSLSNARPLSRGKFLVIFAGLNNILNQTNTFSYTWTRDYSQRIPIRSSFNRTIFVGANLILTKS